MNKEEIISGMQLIMHIASLHCHPSGQDVDDWWTVHSIAEAIHNELEKGEEESEE